MDEDHLAAAYRYVTLNLAPARLGRPRRGLAVVERPRAAGARKDRSTDLAPARQRFARFADLIEGAEDRQATARLRQGETIGRPAGAPAFLADLETRSGRRLAPLKRGPKPRSAELD